jgi:hypothetical protein
VHAKCEIWSELYIGVHAKCEIWSEMYIGVHAKCEIWSEMYIGVYPKCSLFWPDFNETGILSTEFRKILNIKFHENTFSGSRVFPCGQTDMTKLIEEE